MGLDKTQQEDLVIGNERPKDSNCRSYRVLILRIFRFLEPLRILWLLCVFTGSTNNFRRDRFKAQLTLNFDESTVDNYILRRNIHVEKMRI